MNNETECLMWRILRKLTAFNKIWERVHENKLFYTKGNQNLKTGKVLGVSILEKKKRKSVEKRMRREW